MAFCFLRVATDNVISTAASAIAWSVHSFYAFSDICFPRGAFGEDVFVSGETYQENEDEFSIPSDESEL